MRHESISKIKSSLLLAALAAALAGCDSPDVYLPFAQFGGAAGVMDGTVTYSGPLPCTENQRVVGAALLLAFDINLLPPPEGLGTSAASLGVLGGDTLFAGVRDQLTFNMDGSRWCPAPPKAGEEPVTVTVSGNWAISPLVPGTYQVRAFYDLDGDFDPGFSISNLPTKGDVGGGAIDNAAEVLAGAPPVYREVTITASDKGSRVTGIAVTLGLTLPLDRPIFYPTAITDNYGANKDPNNVIIPSDYQLETFSAAMLDESEAAFVSYTFAPGLPKGEAEKAPAKPFLMKLPPAFAFSRQDVDRNGKIDSIDHIPEGALPAFYPLSIFSRLTDGSDITAQSKPAVVIQGLTIWKSLNEMATAMFSDASFQPMDMDAVTTQLKVAIRPAALCLHVTDPTRPGLLVVTHDTDKAMPPHKILTSEKPVLDSLSEQFGRPIELAYGCLPEGRYAMNLVYPTGQAWTVPNESGICAPSEVISPDGTKCGKREKFASQTVVLTVGPPTDPAYCSGAKDAQKIKDACSPIK